MNDIVQSLQTALNQNFQNGYQLCAERQYWNNTVTHLKQHIKDLTDPSEIESEKVLANNSERRLYILSKNGTKKEVIADFVVGRIGYLIFSECSGLENIMCIEVMVPYVNEIKQVYIKESQFTPKKIISEFQKKAYVCFNTKFTSKKLGEILVNYISSQLDSSYLINFKDRAGWAKWEFNETYDFLTNKSSLISGIPISIRGINKKGDITASKAIENYLNCLKVFKDKAHRLLAIAFIHYSLTYEFFNMERVWLPVYMIISGGTKAKYIMHYFFQIFSKDHDMAISINCSDDEFYQHIYSGKDEVLLFTDCNESTALVKKHKEAIANVFSKHLKYERKLNRSNQSIMMNAAATAAIVSDTLAYESSVEDFLLLELNDLNMNHMSFYEIQSHDNLVSDELCYFVEYVKNNVNNYCSSIRENYLHYIVKANEYELEEGSKITFAVIMAAITEFIKFVEMNNVEFLETKEVTEQIIAEYLLEKDELGLTEGVTNIIKETIIKQLSEKKYNLVSQIKNAENINYDEGKPEIYFDDKYFYISKKYFDAFIVSELSLKITSTQALNALKKDGFLRLYETQKQSYEYKPIIYNEYGIRKRRSMIAIKRELVENYGDLALFN